MSLLKKALLQAVQKCPDARPLTDRYEAIRTADLWGEKIPIGVIYRNDEAPCREIREIFRVPLTKADAASRLNMRCVMMR